METSEKIKNGLIVCGTDTPCFGNCAYEESHPFPKCVRALNEDAATRIEQLEGQVATLNKTLEQVKAERDAAISDIESHQGLICQICKQYYRPDPDIRRWSCRIYGNDWPEVSEGGILLCGCFKWRGVSKENKNENA